MPKLYVILRGEFALYYDSNDQLVHALAPDVSGHMYLAGSWESLRDPLNRTVPRGSVLTLRGGETTGTVNPSDRPNHMLNVGARRTTPKLIPWMEVKLPLPVEIHKGLMEDTKSVQIFVTKRGVKYPCDYIPSNPALVLILEYAWDGTTLPYLEKQDGHRWYAIRRGNNAAIHLVASGFWDETQSHVQEAFRAAAQLMGVDAEISWDPSSLEPEKRSEIPEGSELLEDEVNAPWKMAGVQGALHPFDAFETKALRDAAVGAAIDAYLQKQFEDGKGSGNCGPVEECGTCG